MPACPGHNAYQTVLTKSEPCTSPAAIQVEFPPVNSACAVGTAGAILQNSTGDNRSLADFLMPMKVSLIPQPLL